MSALAYVVNLAACAVIWLAAMDFYLRHHAPTGLRQHFTQSALLLVAVGAFAALVEGLHGQVPSWGGLALRVGIAMLAGRELRLALRFRRGGEL